MFLNKIFEIKVFLTLYISIIKIYSQSKCKKLQNKNKKKINKKTNRLLKKTKIYKHQQKKIFKK